MSRLLAACLLTTLLAALQTTPAPAADRDRTLQDSFRLYRLDTAWLPPDGLLTFGLALRTGGPEFPRGDVLERLTLRELRLGLEYGLLPSLHLRAEMPWRMWDGAVDPHPASGSGAGDGDLGLAWAPLRTGLLGVALRAGTSLPTGAGGLTEGEASPRLGLGLTFRFWRDRQVPEMRLHLNGGYRWNRNEEQGYGPGATGLEPWYPLYPAQPPGADPRDNDFLQWGAALEFRAGTASLFLEYSEERLVWADGVAPDEFQRCLTAGTRWGVSEGFALNIAYDVSLSRDDWNTPFSAAYPDMVYSFGLSWQRPLGGRDSDGDRVPDRKDRCPLDAEDRDGFQDEDGCPDLDNDGDGILDADDGEPFLPEDRDGFQDEDGVPDPDNDADGIPDLRDQCPDEAEDIDGHRDEDGCPEEFVDRDGDGIEDAADFCPDSPEDMDGFEDGDGCPDPDNDLDGIEDLRDACPNLPEDYDGDADDDGCPDPMPEPATTETGAEDPPRQPDEPEKPEVPEQG